MLVNPVFKRYPYTIDLFNNVFAMWLIQRHIDLWTASAKSCMENAKSLGIMFGEHLQNEISCCVCNIHVLAPSLPNLFTSYHMGYTCTIPLV